MLASSMPLAEMLAAVLVWLQRIQIHGDRDHAYIRSQLETITDGYYSLQVRQHAVCGA